MRSFSSLLDCGPRWKISQGGSRGGWAVSMGKERCGLGLKLLRMRCSFDGRWLFRRSASAFALELAEAAVGLHLLHDLPDRWVQGILAGAAEPTGQEYAV